ncbi:MAG: DUF3096 domain-containing protein [Candidatus Peribacteraceae bacterium]|nr:DUF3096 domain-containing protein [Candidatus Peribacteraceae bacterium]
MFFFLRNSTGTKGIGSGIRNGLLFNGLLCVVFGLGILAAPELLAYLVAVFLIVVGVGLLTAWWKATH